MILYTSLITDGILHIYYWNAMRGSLHSHLYDTISPQEREEARSSEISNS